MQSPLPAPLHRVLDPLHGGDLEAHAISPTRTHGIRGSVRDPVHERDAHAAIVAETANLEVEGSEHAVDRAEQLCDLVLDQVRIPGAAMRLGCRF